MQRFARPVLLTALPAGRSPRALEYEQPGTAVVQAGSGTDGRPASAMASSPSS